MSHLSVSGLQVRFDGSDGPVDAVDDASFDVEAGQIVGLVGESGSGKSVTARSILGLQSPGRITAGRIDYDGRDLTTVSEATHRHYRGTEIAMVPQDPMGALDPAFDVGDQIAESLRVRDDPDSQSLPEFLGIPPFTNRSNQHRYREQAVELLRRVGVSDPNDRVEAYPHELSGGMRQRVLLAIALAGEPTLLIVDEPTTGLDTTTQARILDLLRTVVAETNTGLLLVTHDVGVVEELCDRTVVMYDGTTLEAGPTADVLGGPKHPYTDELLSHRLGETSGSPRSARTPSTTEHWVRYTDIDATWNYTRPPSVRADGAGLAEQTVPSWETGGDRSGARTATTTGNDPVVEARNLQKVFDLDDSILGRLHGDTRRIKAVDGVDLSVHAGETLGIVGESGSGKSTVVDILAGLSTPTTGDVRFDGESVGTVDERSGEQLADVGVVFQHPEGSINPHRTVREVVTEPLAENGWTPDERDERLEELLQQVGLPAAYAARYPQELSGGQLQRVAIARAIVLAPRVVILDEPTVGLDLSSRARLLDLLCSIQRQHGLTYVVVSHDLNVIRTLADRVLVMYLGRVVERGPTATLFDRPSHPYTAALVAAAPPIADDFSLDGDVPSAVDPPRGCAFHTRCPMAEPECAANAPEPTVVGRAESRCHFAETVADRNE
ncbi:ABC transporter ATP-binding protein [Halococcus sp. IIIV-5B]|uniref:dipeptide ABC transporter ATP-binding protein n=1 Tax=Halococcus sp. IIIV-5B TaxID=2321230 RepID=UPI000E715404|nr:ABC transporter ATP-binding protein [Halococcus sp. IIIV-5B]RJT07426.1 ABC transporter ATP-binding protein [Halococcus sp. IIIV-5B]